MLPYSHRISRYGLAIFFVCLAAYAYYEARGVLLGPSISVASEAITVEESFVRIDGRATHIDEMRMNGNPISVTEDGSFSEPYLLAPGNNRIVLEARDKYGHTTKKTVDIVYDAPVNVVASTSAQTASSTPAATSSVVAPSE